MLRKAFKVFVKIFKHGQSISFHDTPSILVNVNASFKDKPCNIYRY